MLLVSCGKESTAPRVVGTLTAKSATLQSGLGGAVVTEPPAVVVLDQDGQPLAGQAVTFAVTAGGGTVNGSPATSDGTGTARATSWTLGSAGGVNTVRASAGALSTDFQATSLVAATLQAMSAESQQATVGTPVASVPAVRVLDQNGQPLAGVSVGFQVSLGAGAVTRTVAISDPGGLASAGAWTLGTLVGVNSVTASVGDLSTSFQAKGTSGPAARLVYVSGSQQSGTVEYPLPLQFRARVTDQYGNAVKGTSVSLAVTAGQDVGATISPTSDVSVDDGTVQAYLTLGDSAGPNEVSMTAAGLQGSPLVFTASADWRRLTAWSISGQYQHACAAGMNGFAYCWGAGAEGQIGDGGMTNRAIATRVGADIGLASAVAGVTSSCGLDPAGKAYCWGANQSAQLGDGSFISSSSPVAVAGGYTFRELSVGNSTACGLTDAGTAYCWGNNNFGELGAGTPQVTSTAPIAVQGGLHFSVLAVGFEHSCGLTVSGTVYCWGSNSFGEAGTGDTTHRHDTPMAIVSQGKTFIAVAAGQFNSCALDQDGAAYCWGWNQSGELGVPLSTTYSATPIAVSGGLRFTRLFGAPSRYCGVVVTGQMYCWGYIPSTIGSTGSHATPVDVPALAGFTSLVGQLNWLCGIRDQSDAYCVGYNEHGELADGVLGVHVTSTLGKVRAP